MWFSLLCYLFLPMYLMYRLARDAQSRDRRHKEMMRVLRDIATIER